MSMIFPYYALVFIDWFFFIIVLYRIPTSYLVTMDCGTFDCDRINSLYQYILLMPIKLDQIPYMAVQEMMSLWVNKEQITWLVVQAKTTLPVLLINFRKREGLWYRNMYGELTNDPTLLLCRILSGGHNVLNGSDTGDTIYGDGDKTQTGASDDGADFILGENGRIDRRFTLGADVPVLYLPWTVNKVL